MSTIAAGQARAGAGRRMLMMGAACLVAGGIAGGLLVQALEQGGERVVGRASVPAATTQTAMEIEAVRAQNFTAPAPVAPAMEIEAVRAQNFTAPAPVAPATEIEAVRAQNFTAPAEWPPPRRSRRFVPRTTMGGGFDDGRLGA